MPSHTSTPGSAALVRRLPTFAAFAIALVIPITARAQSASAAAPAANPLTAFGFLAGGTWDGTGTWPDGSPLRVELAYTWGPTHRVLHFTTYELQSGKRELVYEGMLFHDPSRNAVFQWNIKPDGSITESRITRVDSAGFVVRGANTLSTIKRTGPDEVHWILQLAQADSTWRTILDAPHRRRR